MATGMEMMLKMAGINLGDIQGQIEAFGEGVKQFSEKLDKVLEAQLFLDAKLEAVMRMMDERMPLVDPVSSFADLTEGRRYPVMMLEAAEQGRDDH